VGLGPFDEVRHDEEVAGEAHLLDDPDLPFQAGPVFLFGNGRRDLGQADFQPLARLVGQFIGLGAPGPGIETRQNGRVRIDQKGAAPRDVDGVVASLGQVGEQLTHHGGGLEPVFAGDAAAILLAGEGAIGDAQQGVVRFRLPRLSVIDVVGGDQRHVVGIGPFDQPRLGALFILQPVALQLDVEAVAERRPHRRQSSGAFGLLALGEQRIDRAVRATGQQDQPFGAGDDLFPGHARLGHFSGVQIGG